MELRIFQKGFNYSQDGPGNRLVYHLQGCNLRCPWCANPEGLSVEGGERYPVEALVQEVLRSRAMFFDGGGVTLTGGEVTLQFDALKELLTRLHAEGVLGPGARPDGDPVKLRVTEHHQELARMGHRRL